MADYVPYLPLSHRRRRDEGGVTTDRRGAIADLVILADWVIAVSAGDDDGRRRTFLADARLSAPDDGELTSVAVEVRSGRRRGIRPLSRALRALLRLAAAAGVEVRVAAKTTGAVALHQSGVASADRRAVIAGRTVVAVDDGWSFGHGPRLYGRGIAIAAFLLGESDVPPIAERPADPAGADTVEG